MILALQFCASPEPEENFSRLCQQLQTLPPTRPLLVCLPESWLCFGSDGNNAIEVAKNSDYWCEKLAKLCREHGIWLAAGTLPIMADEQRYYGASLLFDEQGKQRAHYNKIHLFDVNVTDNIGAYQESRFTKAGNTISVTDTPFGKIGLSVCYDMRFGELYRKMVTAGAQILLIPSAFTVPTGRAHWHTLLRARAIENQCYVIAPAMYGRSNSQHQHNKGRETYGHTLMVSPWGEILDELPHGEGWITCQPNLESLQQIRQRMPLGMQRNNREITL